MSVATATTEQLHLETRVGARSMDVVRARIANANAAASTIAEHRRVILTRALGTSDIVASAAARAAAGGTIAVVSDMVTPGALYWKLLAAGHAGETRLVAAQKAQRVAPTLAGHDLLVVDLDGISCPNATPGVEAVIAAAAAHPHVLVIGHHHTRSMNRCIDELLSQSTTPFTYITLT